MQALHLLALEPIEEMMADRNSYGFRPKRSTADALEACFISLSKRNSAQYILEADIRSCFDKISHTWIKDNIPMDKGILSKWLAAGYMEKDGTLHQTINGVPQGGIISPTILNVTLSGLEKAIRNATSKRKDKVNCSIYADDFIVTGKSKEILEQQVKPVIEFFLRERGLELSQEKTKITHIAEGFDFLSVNIRKYNDGKLIRKPSKKSVKNFLGNIRKIVKSKPTAKTEHLIWLLNPKIRGWANYFRHVCSKRTFKYVDNQIFKMLWCWIHRRHPRKGGLWRKKRYFRCNKLRNWIFFSKITNDDGVVSYLDLYQASSTPIKRHIKIRGEATPYDPLYKEYFNQRGKPRQKANLNKGNNGDSKAPEFVPKPLSQPLMDGSIKA